MCANALAILNTKEEVAVALHEVEFGACGTESGQRVSYAARQFRVIVVANPGLE